MFVRMLCFVVCGWAITTSAYAEVDFSDDSNIAIIDASEDTRGFLDELQAAGVRVIGRYYARCRQGKSKKRLIDNVGKRPGDGKSEIERILAHRAQFGILSIYQYNSNSANKYDGRDKAGNVLRGADCTKPAYPPHDTETEAQLDADAAVLQAKVSLQPTETPIFFGVDFDYVHANKEKMLRYFTKVGEICGPAVMS